MKNILNKEEIELLKISGNILKEALLEVKKAAVPGVSTLFLDQVAEKAILSRGGIPSFKGYEVEGAGKFPSSLCVSINDEVVHGIPSADRIVEEGDIVSLDLGVNYKGIFSDSAITVPVGIVSKEAKELIQTTKECLEIGISAALKGKFIGNIGYEVKKHADKKGFGVVRDLVGHGIGTKAHMEPQIPNFGNIHDGPEIEEGMALAIEPMLTAGNYNVKIGKDGWVVYTKDGSLSAHFEHTIVIENGKPTIVTN